MAFSKIDTNGLALDAVDNTILDLGSTFNFTGTLQQNGTSIGESNVPYFYVTRDSNQTMSNNTHTVLQFDSVEHDTASGYNTSNYRYTPNVAGKYYFEACLQWTYSSSIGNTRYVYLRKNATAVVESSSREGGYGSIAQASGILTMNGSSDYVDIQVYGNPTGNFIAEGNGTNKRTYFLGYLISAT
jgi:hypothetical protein